MVGLQVRVLDEQLHDELRSGRFLDVSEDGFPMLLFDLETCSECAGRWLTRRKRRTVGGRLIGHGFLQKRSGENADPPQP
jgi:hypothetical protein